jgi:hypothetical protein
MHYKCGEWQTEGWHGSMVADTQYFAASIRGFIGSSGWNMALSAPIELTAATGNGQGDNRRSLPHTPPLRLGHAIHSAIKSPSNDLLSPLETHPARAYFRT